MRQAATEHACSDAYPPMVLLHGIFGKPTDWEPCERHFSSSSKVSALRLSFEDFSRAQCSLDHMVSHVTEFLDRHNIDRVILGGHSFGGHIALHIALRYPLRVAGLILVGSSGLFERGYERGVPHRPDHAWLRTKIREVFFDETHVTETLVEEISNSLSDRRRTAVFVRMASSAKRDNLRAVLHLIRTPALLVWGRNDNITPPSVAHEFKKRLPLAELEFINECGHVPTLEKPHEFNLIVERFLQRHFLALHAR
jgi:pimeloyl-ACP methyl ester carboxylesterase